MSSVLRRIRKVRKGEKGFTLIELLVVIIIIAILAAIAIPTFLGQRQKAQDAAAKALVRNAMTSIESAYVETLTFDTTGPTLTVAMLQAIEPSIKFVIGGTCTAVPALTTTLTKATGTAANTVNYTGTVDTYTVSTMSASGDTFGVYVSKNSATAGQTFVKIIGAGAAAKGW